MELVAEAAKANVTLGGYTEGVAGHYSRACYRHGKVYISRDVVDDPILAMKLCLFELTNGISGPRHSKLQGEAGERNIKREDYPYVMVETEVEGAMRVARIWKSTKPLMIRDGWQQTDLDKYDKEFWIPLLSHTKEDNIQMMLGQKYTHGTLKGKTVRERFLEAYDRMHETNVKK